MTEHLTSGSPGFLPATHLQGSLPNSFMEKNSQLSTVVLLDSLPETLADLVQNPASTLGNNGQQPGTAFFSKK